MTPTKERKTAHIDRKPGESVREKKPIRFQIETTDIDFFLALVKWIDKYPAVREGSTVLRFLGDQDAPVEAMPPIPIDSPTPRG